MNTPPVMWRPGADDRAASVLHRFIADLQPRVPTLLPATDDSAFRALHRWSVTYPAEFWHAVWRNADIVGDVGNGTVLVPGNGFAPPARGGARWFPEARLNFAENLLRHTGEGVAIVGWDERGRVGQMTHDQLRAEVARVADGFRHLGVMPGDRVAGWLPNITEAVVAMLAAASLGAVWTSCSPDFGVNGVVDRFGQTRPVLMLFADGYRYAGKHHDCTARVRELLDQLPSVRAAIRIRYLGSAEPVVDERVLEWHALGSAGGGHCPGVRAIPV